MFATPPFDDVHVPPPAALLKTMADPWQTLGAPSIADGDELTETVTVVLLEQVPFVDVTV